MKLCPVCGKPLNGAVCACGYDENRKSVCRLMPDPIPKEWLSAEKEGEDYPVFGNRSLLRKSVRSVTFVDSLAQKGKNAWDVSEAKDGTVWAWTVPAEYKLVDLYIGANGRILAPENSERLFAYYTSARSIRLSCLLTDVVTDMNHMFFGCISLTALDISHFDTTNVTNMSSMFEGCTLTTLDVSHFNTANVTDMNHMFFCCESLTTLDVSNFDTGNVTDMHSMFFCCRSLTTLDVSNFDTGNVTDMSFMFSYCSSLTALDVSHFDTAKVTFTYMIFMFSGCSLLTRRGVKLPASERDAESLLEQLPQR